MKGARGPHKIKMNPYDPQKHVWIMDDNLHQLFKFTYDGKLVQTWGEQLVRGEDDRHFGRPTDIDWLPDGTFFVSDGYTNTRVVKFSPEGKYLTSWGTSSEGKANPGPNEMHTVHSIAVGRDRKLYVSDRTNSRIQIFDENGKFLDMWTNIRRPYHVLMSRDQFLWVSDGETHKMLKYDLSGKFLYGWGTFGPLPGRLNGVHQFSVDQENNLVRRRSLQRPRAEIPPAQRRRSGEADRTGAQARRALDEVARSMAIGSRSQIARLADGRTSCSRHSYLTIYSSGHQYRVNAQSMSPVRDQHVLLPVDRVGLRRVARCCRCACARAACRLWHRTRRGCRCRRRRTSSPPAVARNPMPPPALFGYCRRHATLPVAGSMAVRNLPVDPTSTRSFPPSPIDPRGSGSVRYSMLNELSSCV